MGTKPTTRYDVFLSYRREGGESTAKMIKDTLEQRGYRVFFDVESLRATDFNTELYSVIEHCKDFVLVLAPGSLDRTQNEGDWLRLEIAHALQHQKNIVPILLRGFSFPEQLPKDIDAVRYKNGQEANTQLYEAFIDRLTKKFLRSKPSWWRRIIYSPVFQRTWPVLLAVAVLAVLATGGALLYRGIRNGYPATQAEKNLTGEVLLHIERHLAAADAMLDAADEGYDACADYLTLHNDLAYQEALSAVGNAYAKIKAQPVADYTVGDALSAELTSSPYQKDDFLAFHDYTVGMQSDLLDDMLLMRVVVSQDNDVDQTTQMKLIKLKQEWADCYGYDIVYGTNELLLPVTNDFLKEFQNEMLPIYTHLPFESVAWQRDEDTLDGLLEASYNKAADIKDDIVSLVGDKHMSAMTDEVGALQKLLNLGFSQTEAQSYIAGMKDSAQDLAQLEAQLEQLKLDLESTQQSLKQKYAPQESDNAETLWGKMLFFLKNAMYDTAVECAQAYQQKVSGSDEYADTYMPIVISFIRQIGTTGIDYGLIVLGYEPDKPHHALYQIGDIIVALNGAPCRTVEEYNAVPRKEANTVTLLRQDDTGRFSLADYSLPSGQAGVLLYNLSEEETD